MKGKKLFSCRNITRAILAAGGIYLSLRYTAQCSRGIKNGILFCIEVLMPSLYLFMVISAYVAKSGLAVKFSKPFGRLIKGLFGLPPTAAAVLLSSVLGGYPVGARCCAILYEEGILSESEAIKTALVAVCAGPGFLLSFVGSALLDCPKAGVILLVAEIMGMLLTGMIGKRRKCTPTARIPTQKHTEGNLLVRSVSDASKAALLMCAMVVLCSAMIEVVSAIVPNETLSDIVSALLEITAGCQRLCGSYPLYLLAFFIGFGGISVHLQISAALGELRINKGLFFLYRILQGIITAGIAYILCMVFPVELSVFNSVDVPLTAAKSATLAGSAALVLCALCFIGSMRKAGDR